VAPRYRGLPTPRCDRRPVADVTTPHQGSSGRRGQVHRKPPETRGYPASFPREKVRETQFMPDGKDFGRRAGRMALHPRRLALIDRSMHGLAVRTRLRARGVGRRVIVLEAYELGLCAGLPARPLGSQHQFTLPAGLTRTRVAGEAVRACPFEAP
jgi:hypothetical protein